METCEENNSTYLLCDSHVAHAAFVSKRHGERVKLLGRPTDRLHPKKMVIKSALPESGNAHFVPVKEEAIYQTPYNFFIIKLFISFDRFKFLYPFLAQFLFDLDFFLFIEVIVTSVIRWDDTRLLDVTKEID